MVMRKGIAVDLTENPSALRRWKVCGPRWQGLLESLKLALVEAQLPHEHTEQAQEAFARNVK